MMLAGLECRQKYSPPLLQALTGYLVVEGVINAGQDTTRIRLSRTKKLDDSAGVVPEAGATVLVQSEGGDRYQLSEDSAGYYTVPYIGANPGQKFRLFITTAGNRQYASDYVEFKKTPPIDSISWERKKNGVYIYANTHDNTNKTRYYRWEYVETWEHHAAFESDWEWRREDTQIVYRTPAERTYKCYTTRPSSDIVTTSTAKLSSDVVYDKQIIFIPASTERLGVKYSVLVKQYAITAEAYKYWQQLSALTEQLGSIFSVEPTELTGNIHCLTDSTEPVIGFVSASTVEQQRIFIDRQQIGEWYWPIYTGCDTVIITDFLQAWYEVPVRPIYPNNPYFSWFEFSTESCTDCRFQGGTLVKPPFWP
ncbi:MAG TPA: DUF4249 domain-containing protein [Chitinophagaceae bacterium]|nr:DUF4249 domain-containing protein [Chitinophagaceae bacterium]